MRRICGDVQIISFIPDEKLNILIYETPSSHRNRSYTLFWSTPGAYVAGGLMGMSEHPLS